MSTERPKRIGLDFDGVLHSYTSGYTGIIPEDPPVEGAVAFVTWLTEQGYDIHIFTARLSVINDLNEDPFIHRQHIKEWMHAWGFPMSNVKSISGHKPAADLFIDDNGFRFKGDFAEIISGINSGKLLVPWYKESKELDEHDRTCSCPGAQTRRHKADKLNPDDELPLMGCFCRRCTLAWEGRYLEAE